jgi:hypothetical protein
MPIFEKSKGYKMKGFSGFRNSPVKSNNEDIIKAQSKLDEVELGYKTPEWFKSVGGKGKSEDLEKIEKQ